MPISTQYDIDMCFLVMPIHFCRREQLQNNGGKYVMTRERVTEVDHKFIDVASQHPMMKQRVPDEDHGIG